MERRNDTHKAVALLLAAGASTRMEGIDKTLTPLAGKPVLLRSLEVLLGLPEVERILIVTAAKSVNLVTDLADGAGFGRRVGVVVGGAERQDSARLGLSALAKNGPVGRPVLIHDASRPLADRVLVGRVLAAIPGADGVVPVVPVNDTIKRVAPDGSVEATLQRELVCAAQTPQGFLLRYILELHERAAAEGYYAADDAALVERYGGRVVTVEGDPANVKITRPLDVEIAEAILKLKVGRSQGLPTPPVSS